MRFLGIRTRVTLMIGAVVAVALIITAGLAASTVEDVVTDVALESRDDALRQTEENLNDAADELTMLLFRQVGEAQRQQAIADAAEAELSETVDDPPDPPDPPEPPEGASEDEIDKAEAAADAEIREQEELADRAMAAQDRAQDRAEEARDRANEANDLIQEVIERAEADGVMRFFDGEGESVELVNYLMSPDRDFSIASHVTCQITSAEGDQGGPSCEIKSESVVAIDADSQRIFEQRVYETGTKIFEDPTVISVGRLIRSGEQDLMIVLAQDIESGYRSSTSSAFNEIGPPILLALVLLIAALIWFALGRALKPMQAITAQVDQISGDSLEQRITVPSAKDELHHLATTMNRMLDRLQWSRDSQRRFISDASHELRSPITATTATLEVARANPQDADWEKLAQVLTDENGRLAQLVDDLLLLARLDEEQGPLDRSVVDLDELCLTEAHRPHPSKVTVRVNTPARVNGSHMMLTRAVRNLVDNAARHAASAVEIIVDVSADGPNVGAIVQVGDDGPGVSEYQSEAIFERFSRLDDDRNRASGGGAGLGLAIVRGIAEAHDGTVAVARNSKGGATFTLWLPMTP